MKIPEQENLSTNRDVWNALVSNSNADFLQSWQWGEFQKFIGQQVWRLIIDGVPGQMIKYSLPLGQSYFYVPHVRIENREWRIENKDKIVKVIKQIIAVARKEKVIFVRVDPLIKENSAEAEGWRQVLEELGFQKAPQSYYFSAVSQTPYAAILDVSISEQEILKRMRYNTRRSIRLAREQSVVIAPSDDLVSFYQLLRQTSVRKGFSPHPKEHYYKLKEAFGDDLVLFLASCQCHSRESGNPSTHHSVDSCPPIVVGGRLRGNDNQKLLAGAMVLFFNKQAIYLHAGSLPGEENHEASYLVLWQAIQEAKKRGCQTLDLGAVIPQGAPASHPWQSITTFKMGFRPKRLTYLGAYDWVNKKIWYQLYCLRKKFSIFNF